MDEAAVVRVTDRALVAALRTGDGAAFADVVARYRGELHVHCYRMLGSFDDAEDAVQETFARAWRSRGSYEGRSSVRAWLYRIATNACLASLERRRPARPAMVADGGGLPSAATVPWLQPYPDRLLDDLESAGDEPADVVVAKETIELAFLMAIQRLPPRQRAVLILRDVLGWPASETASSLEVSVASVKSALQRARATLRNHVPRRRDEWAPSAVPTDQERAVLRRYIDAHEHADPAVLAELLRKDARMTMPPEPGWYQGRDAIIELWSTVMLGPNAWGQWRMLPTRANQQPAFAHYLRRPDESGYRPSNFDVLRVEDGVIVEIVGFDARPFPVFGLPPALGQPA